MKESVLPEARKSLDAAQPSLRKARGEIHPASVFAGVQLAITPVQILWINMTTAVLLGLMLAFEPKARRGAVLEGEG